MIWTWVCKFCGWGNCNHNGPCNNCNGQTKMVPYGKNGKYKEMTIKEPNIPHADRISPPYGVPE